MNSVAVQQQIASAATVLFAPHGDVTRLARQRGVCRQTLYRQSQRVCDAVDGTATQQRLQQLQERLQQLQERLQQLQQQLTQAVLIDADKQAQFASLAQAEGVSLPVARRLLAVFLTHKTPSVATLGRKSHKAAQRASALLQVLDEHTRPKVRQAAADEIFVGRRPILMVVEQDSLCWVSGRQVDQRDGVTWAQEFATLPALEQVSRDAGNGLQKGLSEVNRQRRQRGQAAVADQLDHFHTLREGTRALRRLQYRVARLIRRAEATDKELTRRTRQGLARPGGLVVASRRQWHKAEQAMDQWQVQEKAWHKLRRNLGVFTSEGTLNTRAQAEALVAEVCTVLVGPEWSKCKRLLRRPQMWTFLDGVQEQLAAVPLPASTRALLVRREGLRRVPELTQGPSAQASALRGVLLVAAVVLSRLGESAPAAVQAVRQGLCQAWRASSLVEGINSVLRMQQSRHRCLTQGLLDLKRLYWNSRAFRTGKRARKSPYELLGVRLPTTDWWALLKLTPEELRQQLSEPRDAA